MILAIVLVARFLLGVFLAFLGGMALHVLAMIVLLSFYPPSPGVVMASSIIGGGIGGSLVGFLAWYTPGGMRKQNVIVLVLALVGGVAGALLGLLQGVGEQNVGGMPGIPELASLLYGTVIGVNLLPLAYFLFRRWRGERFLA